MGIVEIISEHRISALHPRGGDDNNDNDFGTAVDVVAVMTVVVAAVAVVAVAPDSKLGDHSF